MGGVVQVSFISGLVKLPLGRKGPQSWAEETYSVNVSLCPAEMVLQVGLGSLALFGLMSLGKRWPFLCEAVENSIKWKWERFLSLFSYFLRDWSPDRGASLPTGWLLPPPRPAPVGAHLTPGRESHKLHSHLWATTMGLSFIPFCFFISSVLVPLRNWTQTSYCLTSQHQHHVAPLSHTLPKREVRVKMQAPSPGNQHQAVITLLLKCLLLEIKSPSETFTGSFHTQRMPKLSLHQELVCESDTAQFENLKPQSGWSQRLGWTVIVSRWK